MKRFFRYLAPNLVTATSLIFGMLSIKSSIHGEFTLAGWFVMFCVVTDKVDGFVARLVRGSSEFGVQLDSFADFLCFGVAPAALWYSYFSAAPELPFAEGGGQVLLLATCAFWLLVVTFRLARYNIVNDDPKCRHIFFGVPTTLAACCMVAVFLSMNKYAEPALYELARMDTAREPHIFGGLITPHGLWLAFPGMIVVGAVLMASSVRIPKLGKRRSKVLTFILFGSVVLGSVLGFLRLMPDLVCIIAVSLLALSLGYGALSSTTRGLKAPPIFPRTDPPRGKEPIRPEEDLVDEEA